MAACVETLEIIMGEVHEYHARHNTYFIQYLNHPEDREEYSREAWNEYLELKSQKKSLASKYCKLDILEKAFEHLPNLKSIEVNLSSCPFEHPLLQRIWHIPSTKLNARVPNTLRFINIITAARKVRMHTLSHDRLPFEFWCQKGISKKVIYAFQDLRSLKLSLDFSTSIKTPLDIEVCLMNLGSALTSTPHLETLYIGFANGGAHSGVPQFSFADILGEFTWPHLRTLGLEAMTVFEEDIVTFLRRHAATLKRLQVGVSNSSRVSAQSLAVRTGIHFAQGSVLGLQSRIREALMLEKLNMSGMATDQTMTSTNSTDYGEGLYDEQWVRVANAAHEATLALQAEEFVLNVREEYAETLESN
jgi:hypothetical protein